MVWYGISVLIAMVFDMFRLARMVPDDKDMEILLLRQQLMIVRRKQKRDPNISQFEKMMLVTLFNRLAEAR